MSNELPIHANRVRVHSPIHGDFECSGATLDRMIARYLPASPLDMQKHLSDKCPYFDWSDVADVSTALVILGDMCAHEFHDHGA